MCRENSSLHKEDKSKNSYGQWYLRRLLSGTSIRKALLVLVALENSEKIIWFGKSQVEVETFWRHEYHPTRKMVEVVDIR